MAVTSHTVILKPEWMLKDTDLVEKWIAESGLKPGLSVPPEGLNPASACHRHSDPRKPVKPPSEAGACSGASARALQSRTQEASRTQ